MRWTVGIDVGGTCMAGEAFAELRDSVFQLGAAAMQVARTGSKPQLERAAEILAEARRKTYAVLAEA